ncbi:MAG: 50S ribosomal protein L3 [Planctomycetota bacterium]
MMTLILGRKRGMTQVFEDDGTVVPVTIVEAGPCTVTQVRTQDTDGYDAVQLAFEDVKDARSTKPLRGHYKKAGTAPKRFMREERLVAAADKAVGDTVTVEVFAPGDVVDVVGTSKGRGFAGTIKRHGFARGSETHGCMNVRQPGSIGASAYPSRVFKGMRMSGHYGAKRQTTKNLKVVRVDAERNLIFVRGSVPGPNGGFVQVRTARTGAAGKRA